MTAEEREIEHEEEKKRKDKVQRGGGRPCFPRVDVITV